MLIQDGAMAEGQDGKMSSIDQHGCTPLLGINTHHWTMAVVEESSLERRGEEGGVGVATYGDVSMQRALLTLSSSSSKV